MTKRISQDGQALIQVLVAAAIALIVILGLLASVVNQQREVRALSEQLAADDVQKLVMGSLGDPGVCRYILNHQPTGEDDPLTFDSTVLTAETPQTIDLTAHVPAHDAIYASFDAATGKPGPIAIRAGQAVSAYSNSLVVQSIKLLVLSGAGDSFVGTWRVEFDPSKTVRAVKPAALAVTLTADLSDPAHAKIVRCGMVAAGGVRVYESGWFDAISSGQTYRTGHANPYNTSQSIPPYDLGRRPDLLRLFYRAHAGASEIEVPTFQVSNAESTFNVAYGNIYGPRTELTDDGISLKYGPNGGGACYKFGPGLSANCGGMANGSEVYTGAYYSDVGQLRIVAYVFN